MYQIKYVTCRFLFLVKTTIIYWRAWHIEHNIAHLHSTARHNMPKFKKEKRRDYLALDRQPWPSVLGIAIPMWWLAESRRTYWNLNNVTISQFTPISQSPSSQYSSWAIFTKKRVHNVEKEENFLKSPTPHCSTEHSRDNVLHSQIAPSLPNSKSDIFALFGFDRRSQKFQTLIDCCHCPAPKATVA